MNDMQIQQLLAVYNAMAPNCIIYWCDKICRNHTTKRYHSSLNEVLGSTVEDGVSPSESLWMFPLWDCFEEASV